MTRTPLIAVIALLLAPAAESKSGLLFDRTSARAGEKVTLCVPCDTRWTSALPNYQPSAHGILGVMG